MSEVQSLALEPEVATVESESGDFSEGVKIVSQMLGISEAEVKQMASDLESALSILDTQGHQLVICDRLGGIEVTLSEAVNAIWPHTATGAMLIEGISSVVAEIHKMLNSKKPETEDEKDPLATDEENTEAVSEAKTASNKQHSNRTEAETKKEQLEQKSPSNNNALKSRRVVLRLVD